LLQGTLTYSVIRILDKYFYPIIIFKAPPPLYDDVICGRSLSFVYVVSVYLLVNEFCVQPEQPFTRMCGRQCSVDRHGVV